jgi:hypothetical protein
MAPKDVEDQIKAQETAHLKVVAAALKGLMGAEGWDTYVRQLELAEIRFTERMIGCNKDEFDRIRGQIEGIRLAIYLPKTLIDRVDAL